MQAFGGSLDSSGKATYITNASNAVTLPPTPIVCLNHQPLLTFSIQGNRRKKKTQQEKKKGRDHTRSSSCRLLGLDVLHGRQAKG